jgi:pimeloyl-ACP methyl ester carboxylesterase
VSERENSLIGPEGRRVAYLERGPDDGKPVLYLHGMPGSRHEQRLVPDAVLDRFGVRLISCDRPGYGGTDPRGGDRIARSRDLLAVADHLGVDRFPLMAVSAGGSYALTVAAISADRVERLVLVGAQMPYDDAEAIAMLLPDQLSLVPFLRDGRNELVVAGTEEFRAKLLADPMSLLTTATTTLSPAELRYLEDTEVRAILERDIVEGVGPSAEGLIDDLLAWPRPFEVELEDVRCPVVAVHGDLDDWEPLPNLRRILARLSDAELIVLENRNHFGTLLRPDLLVSLAVNARHH